jgi:hypothetical protein
MDRAPHHGSRNEGRMISLLEYAIFGVTNTIDVHEGSTARLIRKATHQHEIEAFCGCSKARVVGYRRDHQAIAQREQRIQQSSSVVSWAAGRRKQA